MNLTLDGRESVDFFESEYGDYRRWEDGRWERRLGLGWTNVTQEQADTLEAAATEAYISEGLFIRAN